VEFRTSSIPGLTVIEPSPIVDHRGHFARVWCVEDFAKAGLDIDFVQANVQFSPQAGTLRGMHFQREPHQEVKLVRCTRGAVYDVIVDVRPGSPAYRTWHAEVLRADAYTTLWVPEGCAHGYLTLEPDSEVQYHTSHTYAPDAATGVRWDDPAFGIAWPGPVEVISERDATWPLLLGDGEREVSRRG
jgi:dTDP-4-dehydrorhamnose 3,5-epimerase